MEIKFWRWLCHDWKGRLNNRRLWVYKNEGSEQVSGIKILHPGTPAFWHFFKAFVSVSPGSAVAVNSLDLLPSSPRALAIQPFLAHASTLHGALLPPRSQVLMASLSASAQEFILSAPPDIPVFMFMASAIYFEGTSILIISVG